MVESGGEVYRGDGRGSVDKFIEVLFGREVEDLLPGDGEVGFKDGFQESFAVFAETAGAVDIVAEARDDVVIVDGRRDVRVRMFRYEFLIGSAAEVALKKWGLF